MNFKKSNNTPEKKKEIALQFDQLRENYKSKLDPDQYPGNMSLIFELDTRVCVITTDGQTIIGELTSFDNFGSIVLSKARDRVFINDEPRDLSLGIVFIRSEQIMVIGRIDPKKEKELFSESSDDDHIE